MLRTILSLLVALCCGSSLAQRPTADLASLDLADLLRVEVTSSVEPEQAAEAVETDTDYNNFKVNYTYRLRRFDGYREGTRSLSDAEVLAEYPVLPTVIQQQAHILEFSYSTNYDWTYSLSIPYLHQSTEHIRRVGGPFTLKSEGVGDIAFGISHVPYRHAGSQVLLDLGINLPTGTITATGDTPRGMDTQLPYAMQLGTGTVDLTPSIMYGTRSGRLESGLGMGGVFRLGDNDRDYSYGNAFQASAWASYEISRSLMLEGAFKYDNWGGIDGQDRDVDPAIAPVADPSTYGGEEISLRVALNLIHSSDPAGNRCLQIFGAVPLWADLNGPQPEKNWEFGLSVGYSF